MIVTQIDDLGISINGSDKLDALDAHPMPRVRCRKVQSRLSNVELTEFMSVNSVVDWLRITSSLFCAPFSSMLQQCAATATLDDLCRQAAGLCELKRFGTSILHVRPTSHVTYNLFFVMFCDVGRSVESGQLCYIGGCFLVFFPPTRCFMLSLDAVTSLEGQSSLLNMLRY